MSVNKTAIIINNRLVARGLSYYIKTIVPDPEIEIFEKFPGSVSSLQNDYFAVFLDPTLLKTSASYTVEKIYNARKGLKIISVSEKEPQKSIQAYFEAIICFRDTEDEILEKLQFIYQLDDTVPSRKKGGGALSNRETEVLRSVALGLTNKEISDTLLISTHTVITHRKNITAKLGIKTIAGLTVYSVLNGIIDAEDMSIT